MKELEVRETGYGRARAIWPFTLYGTVTVACMATMAIVALVLAWGN